jgi:hypothetical protein
MLDDGVASSTVTFIPSFPRIGQLFKELKSSNTQHGDLSGLLPLRNWSRLKHLQIMKISRSWATHLVRELRLVNTIRTFLWCCQWLGKHNLCFKWKYRFHLELQREVYRLSEVQAGCAIYTHHCKTYYKQKQTVESSFPARYMCSRYLACNYKQLWRHTIHSNAFPPCQGQAVLQMIHDSRTVVTAENLFI